MIKTLCAHSPPVIITISQAEEKASSASSSGLSEGLISVCVLDARFHAESHHGQCTGHPWSLMKN